MALRLITKNEREKENEQQVPVSPSGEILNTCSFALCIHVVAYLDKQVDVSYAKKAMHEILLARSPRFSCVPSKNEKGVLQWQKTAVNVEDHVFVAHFPPLTHEYDKFVEEYICDMHLRKLPPTRPLWEFHFLNYKTTNGEAAIVMNLHHMLGDGFSLMSLLLACSTKSAHNSNTATLQPSLSSTSQHTKHHHKSDSTAWFSLHFIYRIWHRLFTLLIVMWYTFNDLITSFLRLKWIEDSRLPIRGRPGVELLPKVMASTSFSLQDVLKIKKHVGGSVNDVMMGVIFYGFRQYCEIVLPDPKQMESLRVTALALMNTRSPSEIKNVAEMSKSKRGDPNSGNSFGYLHLRVPMEKLKNPLEYVRRAKDMTDKKKMSMAVFLTSRVISYITRFKGPNTSAKALYNTLANTTLTVTNMQGPTEEINLAGYSVKNLFFSVSAVPQTILVSCLSYKDNMRMQVTAVKGYVDANHLSRCFEDAFKEIKEASRS